VQNIRSLVHIVLDLNAGNYTRWRDQILLVIGKYSLDSHVLADLLAPEFPDWTRMDCVVKSWIASTISPDLAEMVIDRAASARIVWCALEDQFLGNRETRALHLDVQFRNLVQGDLSISDFCRRLKSMAQQLADFGEPVTDRTLTLNLIRGLNERFRYVGRHIHRGSPFPKFKDAVNELILEELTMAHQPSAPSTALLAAVKTAPPRAPPPSSSASRPPQQPPRNGGSTSGGGTSGGKPKDRRRRGGKSRLGGTSSSSSSSQPEGGKTATAPSTGGAGGTAWPSFLHPWAGAIQM